MNFFFTAKTVKVMDDLMKKQVISENDEIVEYKKKCIMMEGWLRKRSRYWGSWRNRWSILYNDEKDVVFLCTFKEKEVYRAPTEIITINDSIQLTKIPQKKNEFQIYSTDLQNLFCFKAPNEIALTQWMLRIKNAIPSKPKDSQYYGSYDDENYHDNYQANNNNDNNDNNDEKKDDLL